MPQDQAEQPDDPAAAGIVGEVDHEACEIDLRLDARRRFEGDLIGLGSVLRPDRGQIALHRRIGAGIAHLADLAVSRTALDRGKRSRDHAENPDRVPAYWAGRRSGA
jgi:hypothetical protein